MMLRANALHRRTFLRGMAPRFAHSVFDDCDESGRWRIRKDPRAQAPVTAFGLLYVSRTADSAHTIGIPRCYRRGTDSARICPPTLSP